jgi:hypothetical protein
VRAGASRRSICDWARGRKGAASADLRNAGFEAADLDGDGSLGPEEFLQAAVRDAAGRESAPRLRARLAIFHGLDDEGDGVISREDFMMRTAARFATRDVDGGGAPPVWEFLAILRF